jgi:hypothetical protein
MAEKMLVTQALDERDLLVKKIHRQSTNGFPGDRYRV